MQTPSIHSLEVYRLSNPEETKQEPVYKVKGIPIHAYLIETGEFRWIPTSQACSDKENAEKILKVLKEMPEDRRTVWASRLDKEQAKINCPVINKEVDLCKEFDEFCASYSKPKSERNEKGGGGQDE